jgi:hypothetical protein
VASTATIFLLVDIVELPATSCWLGTTAVITLANFFVCKYWVFTEPANPRNIFTSG